MTRHEYPPEYDGPEERDDYCGDGCGAPGHVHRTAVPEAPLSSAEYPLAPAVRRGDGGRRAGVGDAVAAVTHTPGPWVALGSSVHPDRQSLDLLATIAEVKRRRRGMPFPITRSEAVANARLIAAAPDLLEALRAMVAQEDGTRFTTFDDGNGGGLSTLAYARAAIAKAEGR